MPLTESTRSSVVLGVLALAALWVVSQMALVPARLLGTVMGNVRLLGGLLIILLFGWWALSEAEDDDEIDEVVRKTGDRAEGATKGLLDTTTASIAALFGIGSIVTMGGVQLAGIFADQLAAAPMIGANFVTMAFGVAGALGLAGTRVVVIGGLGALLLGLVIRDRLGDD